MCGRFSLRLAPEEIQQLPGYPDAHIGEWIDQDQFVPRYNIAPRTQAPVVRRRDAGPSNSNNEPVELVLQSMKWGLVPHWSKFEDKTLSTTNARSENIVDGGGMWASIKGKKRCAVVCQGYYEWLTKGKDKLPHFIKHKDGKVMLMAGLYDSVVLEGERQPLWTFTIVTTAANKEFEWLHDRQPVILSTKAALDTWLNTSSQTWTPELTKLVEPYHDLTSPLDCYQVPKEIGRVGTESSTFIEPVSHRKDGIQAMFSKQKQSQSQSSSAKSTRSTSKRKRSRSASPSAVVDFSVDLGPTTKSHSQQRGSPVKKSKLEDNKPDTSKSANGKSSSLKTSPSNLKTPKKGKLQPESSPKITTFFAKS